MILGTFDHVDDKAYDTNNRRQELFPLRMLVYINIVEKQSKNMGIEDKVSG